MHTSKHFEYFLQNFNHSQNGLKQLISLKHWWLHATLFPLLVRIVKHIHTEITRSRPSHRTHHLSSIPASGMCTKLVKLCKRMRHNCTGVMNDTTQVEQARRLARLKRTINTVWGWFTFTHLPTNLKPFISLRNSCRNPSRTLNSHRQSFCSAFTLLYIWLVLYRWAHLDMCVAVCWMAFYQSISIGFIYKVTMFDFWPLLIEDDLSATPLSTTAHINTHTHTPLRKLACVIAVPQLLLLGRICRC